MHKNNKPNCRPTLANMDTDNLVRLNQGLEQEKERLLKQAVSGTRYGELSLEDKRFISTMTKELVQYEHYLKTLSDAAFLNNFIRMVQRFAQAKFRSIYLGITSAGSQALGNSLEEFLYHLRNLVGEHNQINGYLNSQCFRTWAIGSKYNPACEHNKYKAEFRYSFPACDFNAPLVLQNPNLWVDNAAHTFYTLVDAFTKFKGTVVYVMTPNRLVWLGSFKAECELTLSPECSCDEGDPGDVLQLDGRRLTRMAFNLIWLPQFCVSLTFKRPQCLSGSEGSVFVRWEDTHEFECDINRRRALLRRMADGYGCDPFCVEFYYKSEADWKLYEPFEVHVEPSSKVGSCSSSSGKRVTVASVSEHPTTLCLIDGVGRGSQGKRMNIEFVCSAMGVDCWKPHIQELVGFYKTLLHRIDMLLLGTESQTKQLTKFMDCIRKNVAMQEDLLNGFMGVNNSVAIAKLRTINQLIQNVDHILKHEGAQPVDLRRRPADPSPCVVRRDEGEREEGCEECRSGDDEPPDQKRRSGKSYGRSGQQDNSVCLSSLNI